MVCCHEKLCGFGALMVTSLNDAIFLFTKWFVLNLQGLKTLRVPRFNALFRGINENARKDSNFSDEVLMHTICVRIVFLIGMVDWHSSIFFFHSLSIFNSMPAQRSRVGTVVEQDMSCQHLPPEALLTIQWYTYLLPIIQASTYLIIRNSNSFEPLPLKPKKAISTTVEVPN